MSEEFNFDFNEINLDFLLSSPPKRSKPQYDNISVPKQDCILESTTEPTKGKKIKCAQKRVELAKKINEADTLLTQINKLEEEKVELAKQLVDFQRTANEIKKMYIEEKQQYESVLTALCKSQKKCDTVESEMANKQFKYEQMQAQWDEERKRPIDYDDLALKFIKVVQKFEDNLYKPDIAIVEDIKRYCISKKLKMPLACATSPKKVRSRNSRIKKQEQSIQCELWREEGRVVKDEKCLVDQATQCQVERQEQGTQHISTMTTRGTTTREFIKQHHVSTCFPEPTPIPSVEAILKEISQWNVMRISPIRDLTPEMDTKIYKTVGTCTWLCNVRRKIDFMPNKVSRPPSRQCCQCIKQEIKTPAPSPTPTNTHTPKQTSIRSDVEQSVVAQRTLPQHHHHTHETVNETTLNALNTPVFEELWQVFGKMVRGLLQHNNAAVRSYTNNFNEINQQQFHDWLRQLYENTCINQNGQNENRSEVRTALTTESSIQTETEHDVVQENEDLPNFKETLQGYDEHIVRPQARHAVQTQMSAEMPADLQLCVSPKAKDETEEILRLTKENINFTPARKSLPLKTSKMKKKKKKKLRSKILNRSLSKSEINAVDFLATLTTFHSDCNALGEESILKNSVQQAETRQHVEKENLMLDLFGSSDDEICKKGIHERSKTVMELRHNANAVNSRTDINSPFSISPILKSNKEENDKKTKEYQNSTKTASSMPSICDIELCEKDTIESEKVRPPEISQDVYYANNNNMEYEVCLEKSESIADKTQEQHNAHNNASSLPNMANNLEMLMKKVEEKNRENNLCQDPYAIVPASHDLSEAERSESCAEKINEYEELSNKNTVALNRFSTKKNDLELLVKQEAEKPTTKCLNQSQDDSSIITVNSSNCELKNYMKNTENATVRRKQSHVLTKDTFNISASCENVTDLCDEEEKCENENISSRITASDSHNKCAEICETATKKINEQKWPNFILQEDLELSEEEEEGENENMTENVNRINGEKPSHTSTEDNIPTDENNLTIDEGFTEATNENSDSPSSNEGKSHINESMNSTKLSNLFNNSVFEEILTDSIRPILSEMLTESQSVSTPIHTTTTTTTTPTSIVKTRKRLNDSLLEGQAQSTPCKRSARLSAKREPIKNHSEIIGKYTKTSNKTFNYELRSMSKLSKNLQKVNDMKEMSKEEEKAVPITLGFFKEQSPTSEQPGNDIKNPEQDNISTHEPQGWLSNKIKQELEKSNHEMKSTSINETLHSHENDNSHLLSKLEQNETSQSADSLTINKVLSTTKSSVLNVAFCESPQSPPPYQSSESEPTEPKLIPLENLTAKAHFEKHDNKFLFDQLIASYDINIYKTLNSTQNTKKKSSALKERILSHLREFCYTDTFQNGNVMASQLVKAIQHITTDYEQVYSAVIATAQDAPASEVREKDLPSVIQETPPKHLSRVLKRLHYVLKRFFYMQPDFCSTLMSHIEQLLFTLKQCEGVTLTQCLNLTQLYLLACEVQKNHLDKNPARLFIANCLYFYNAKAILMIHEVLMWHPTVLPPREERTYDRSDAIITVIQHLLMNTKYDMDKADLRGRTLLSKLRYEYHFEPFQPAPADVIVNLMDKLKANKLQYITYAFALLCKRMPPEKTIALVLNEHLIPLAHQYYQFAQQSDAYDTRIVALLHIIAVVVKPFPLEMDITKYLTLFARFLNATDRPLIKEHALSSILTLKRFGYINCYNLVCRYKATHAMESTTRAMIKSFLYRKPKEFWKNAHFQNKG